MPVDVAELLRARKLDEADDLSRQAARETYESVVKHASWEELWRYLDEATGGLGYTKQEIDDTRMTVLGCLIAWPEAVQRGARVLEVGTGIGRTCYVVTWTTTPSLYLTIDRDPLVLAIALYRNPIPHYREALEKPFVKIALSDARRAVRALKGMTFDHVVHDGGPCPSKNPRLWSKEFLENLASLLKSGGTMSVFAGRHPGWIERVYRTLRELGLRAWTEAMPGFKVRVVRAEKP